jgi:prepilin-type N-terminal cleavage/methylation domain-containing protein
MRRQQSGFTLVEIAIVLVIIGLLLGGILKGQELINSARVKNLANDYRTIPTYVYAYQDKFKALPGDDCLAKTHVGAPAVDQPNPCTAPFGNGVINGLWNSTTATDETFLFWQHVRLANLAAGPTNTTDPEYIPKNAMGAITGISSATDAQIQIDNSATNTSNPMRGTYQICQKGILGKFAKQLDIQMDDGNTASGSMRAQPDGAALGSASTATASLDDALPYTVCMVF